jgi:hypothetical protein
MQIKSGIAHALIGAMTALVSSYFVALLFAYTFRIPIPMAAYYGPLGELSTYALTVVEVLKMVLVAWVFYGIFGGFIILTALGAAAGVVAGRSQIATKNSIRKVTLYSALAGAIPVIGLSVLDYVIGPW